MFRRELTQRLTICVRFNSYMCGECFCRYDAPAFQLIYVRGMFRGDEAVLEVLRQEVSTHICAGNVSRFKRRLPFRAFVSTHICAGNVSAPWGRCWARAIQFQLIYVRGMFPAAGKRGDRYARVSTHIWAGNVSAFMRGFAILDGANPQELDCSLRVRVVIYRMR